MVKDLSYVDKSLHGYEVDDDGTVYSKYTGEPMTGSLSHSGHLVVRLNGKAYKVHRLVARCFVTGDSDTNTIVHHKNGNKLDNRADNLQWVTPAEHNRLHSGGHKERLQKLSQEDKQFIRDNYTPKDRSWSVGALAKRFSVSKPTILRVLHGDSRA